MIGIDDIVKLYKTTDSIKATARELGLSVQKVRKGLISAGVWSSPESDAVAALLEQGLSADEIANKLACSSKKINAYTPYTKGMYNGPKPTLNALRIKKSRGKA